MGLPPTFRQGMRLAVLALLPCFAIAATADDQIAVGRQVFVQCAVCHSVQPGVTKIGPSLYGIFDRPTASIASYRYSAGMLAMDKRWDSETLDLFLTDPRLLVPGTYMAAAGIRKAQDRQALLAYLATLQ